MLLGASSISPANSWPMVTSWSAVEAQGVSNCPLCAIGHDANAKRIYKESEMDADHVTAWSKGGATNEANCQMLCKTHNRAKGNR
jgi:5-methylcytosine-specific restriction endonuclease McrA